MTSTADASGIVRFGAVYWSSPFQSLSDIAIGFFALWTLVWNACYFLGGSLALAAYFFPIVLGLSLLIPLLRGSGSRGCQEATSASWQRFMVFRSIP